MRFIQKSYDTAVHWFGTMWPNKQRRWVLINEYRDLSTKKLLLADIALRANVYGPIRAETDRQAWIEEGRRQLALEIIKAAKSDPDQLFEQIERRPQAQEKNR